MRQHESERIVVTGLGIYCSVARNPEEFHAALRGSVKGFRRITEFEIAGCRNDKAGLVEDVEPFPTRNGLRANIMLGHASAQAIDDASLRAAGLDGSRVGVTVGTSLGGVGGYVDWLMSQPDAADPYRPFPTPLNPHNALRGRECINNIPPQLLAYDVARRYGFSGVAAACVTACSASANAISIGADFIRGGRVDAMVVTGVDALSPLTVMGFHSLMALTKEEPMPFDRDRSGLLVGEAAAALILERESLARARGAPIYAELAGYGLSNDAFHVTQPHPEGAGAVLAMRQALDDADMSADEIGYIHMHGTATRHNDPMELAAMREVFGSRAPTLPISSIKGAIGHTLGAAGTVGAVSSVLALRHGFLPPNLNYKQSIEGYTYDVVTEPRACPELRAVMTNAFAFAGNCASLIFRTAA
jgi:3-oxoacyl-[acyl-carrier-protein] synthase II